MEKWGGVIRMKYHLAGTHDKVAPCSQHLQKNMLEIFLKSTTQKDRNESGDVNGKITKARIIVQNNIP